MAGIFQKATKRQSRLRMALDGPSGSGKTYTALAFATALANGGGIAVIDTERGSASKYADLFTFDVLELETFAPQQYIAGIEAAEQAGYAVLVIDSLSHAWEGEGGVLDLHDQATKRDRSGNSYTAWKDITPLHRKLVDAILQSRCHIIVTMRSKTEYVLVPDDKGRQVPKKIGMAPVQRQGMEYEFDIVADLDIDHNMVVSKSRCFAVADDVVSKPDAKWFAKVAAWLTDGAPEPERKAPAPEPDSKAPGEQKVTKSETSSTQGGQPVHSTKPTRPYDPDTLKKGLAQKAAKGGADVASEGKRGAVVGALDNLFTFGGDDKDTATGKRHDLLSHLTGSDTSKGLTDGWCDTLLEWAQEETAEGKMPKFLAVQEAAFVIKLLAAEAGQ